MRNIIPTIGLAIAIVTLVFVNAQKVNGTGYVNAVPSTGHESVRAAGSSDKNHFAVMKIPVLTLAKKTTALLHLTDNAW